MSVWYEKEITETNLIIKFRPKDPDRFWPPDIIRQIPLSLEGVAGKNVVLTGPGAVWMYAHAAAVLRVAGAQKIITKSIGKIGTSTDLLGCESMLITEEDEQGNGTLFLIKLRSSPTLSPNAIDCLLEPSLKKLEFLRPQNLVISGRAPVDVYARTACAAVDVGAIRITCWSARDGLVIVHDTDVCQLGRQIARPTWLGMAMPKPVFPLVVGVAGDPNLGKSVFSSVLDSYRDVHDSDKWKLDCDGQSPTPPWYLSLIGDDAIQVMRQEQKRSWTAEMEAIIVEQLRKGRELFMVLIADLPGGNIKALPPERVPSGRERIFAEIDTIILLDSKISQSEASWREALRPHGFEERIGAVLVSCDPNGPASLAVREENGIFRGKVTGLNRSRSSTELANAFKSGLDQLWPGILNFARR